MISPRLCAPALQLDLLEDHNLTFVTNIIQEPACLYVHFAPPCGTASRARCIKRKGRHNPPPLRSDKWPDGLPNLSGLHKAKVASANHLYNVTQQLCQLCVHCGVYFSSENPARSFMWDTEHMSSVLSKCFRYKTFFHHCMYGSSRRKHTCLVHNIPQLVHLQAL